jgi:antitoxin component YwqK of YwqJK toxin-antitoxin module
MGAIVAVIAALTVFVIYVIVPMFGEKQDKIFYDKDWKGCSQSAAAYYRLVTYDDNGKLASKILDYFITGELLGEIDGAINIDIYDDSRSKFIGQGKWFYKNGTPHFEKTYDNSGNQLTFKEWYQNGNIKAEYSYNKDGQIDDATDYYENGNLFKKSIFSNGKLVHVMEYDKFGESKDIEVNDYTTAEKMPEVESTNAITGAIVQKIENTPVRYASIKGKSVIFRASHSTTSDKLGYLNDNEQVVILREHAPTNANEAISNKEINLHSSSGTYQYTLPKGKAMKVTKNSGTKCNVSFNHHQYGEMSATVNRTDIDFISGDIWYSIKRNTGETGWVFSKFVNLHQ